MTLTREQIELTLGSRFAIERELGGAGMSRVFLAEDRELGRRIVVKVLPPERAYEAREPTLAWLHIVPFGAFENLRKDARFDALLDRIGMAKQMRAASSRG